MAKHRSGWLVALAIAVGLGGCHLKGGGKDPTGQVVATVKGQEITITELRAETGAVATNDPKARKAAEQAALQRIITRKILADAAIKQKLDKTPDFAIDKQRTMDALLAETLEKKLAADIPAPVREDAERYVSANPNLFADRKLLIVDQVRMARPNASVVAELEPLHNMDDVVQVLTKDNVPFQRMTSTLDPLQVDPRLMTAIMNVPPHEPFILPAAGGLMVNQVREERPEPLTGEPAVTAAMAIVTQQRRSEALVRQLKAVVTAGASSVRYNKDYKPAAPPPAAAARPKT